jgi:hypothetical protein
VRILLHTGVSVGFDVLSPLEVSISRSLRVEGGPDNNIISEFDGPVILNNKLTSTSDKGMEAASIFLQGDATVSRKFTVGISTPSLSGNPGDVVYNARPDRGGYLGWVYTNQNDWYRFGNISISQDKNIAIFDQVGVGTTARIPGDNTFQVGSGSSEFFVNGSGQVGVGTDDAQGYKMYINGPVFGEFIGNGAGLTNLDSIWIEDYTSSWIFTRENADLKVGIGTTIGVTAQLQVAGTAATSLYVTNGSRFISTATFESEVSIGGTLSATKFNLNGPSQGYINVGVTTSNIIHVGVAGTVLNVDASTANVGIGTISCKV